MTKLSWMPGIGSNGQIFSNSDFLIFFLIVAKSIVVNATVYIL